MRHDKPWLNRKVKSTNLGLDRALLGHDRSHTGVVDTSLLLRQDFTAHGLHLNSRGKKKLFWGNSSYSIKIFILQKTIIRILADAQPRTSCRSLFKKLQSLSIPCQYIQSILNFVVNNQETFQTNLEIHNINTRNKHHLHRSNANLSCFQKKCILCWH
jgi:hypothetical protein